MTTREIRINAAHSSSPVFDDWYNILVGNFLTTTTIPTLDKLPTNLVVSRTWTDTRELLISDLVLPSEYPPALPYDVARSQHWDSFARAWTFSGLIPGNQYTFTVYLGIFFATEPAVRVNIIGDASASATVDIDPSSNGSEYSIVGVADSSGEISINFENTNPSRPLIWVNSIRVFGVFSYKPSIGSVGTNDVVQLGFVNTQIEMGAGGNNTTEVRIESQGVVQAQTFSIVNDNLIIIPSLIKGNLPFGSSTIFVVSNGVEYSKNITLESLDNEYVIINEPIYDTQGALSVLDNIPVESTAPVNNEQLEIRDSTNTVTLFENGLYEVESGGAGSFEVRRWVLNTKTWGDWETITVSSSSSPEAETFIGYQFNSFLTRPIMEAITRPIIGPILGGKFLPSDVGGLSVWLDASDTTTITQSSGSVSVWADKSGNGNNATQAQASLQMTTGARTQNGLNVLDSTGDLMSVSYNINQSVRPNITIIMVYATDIASGSDTALWGNENGGSARFYSLSNTGGNAFSINTGSGFTNVPNVNDTNVRAISFVIQDQVASGSRVFSNKTLELTYTENVNDDLTTFTIGAISPFGVWAMNGIVAECLIYSRALGDSERNDIEDYLISKWGI